MIMNLVSFSDNYSTSTASNMLWFKDTGTGNVILKQIFEQVANDAYGNAVRDGVQALVDTYNNNQILVLQQGRVLPLEISKLC